MQPAFPALSYKLAIFGVITLILSSCSTGAYYKLNGQIFDHESKKPVRNLPIVASLPQGFGMSASEVGIGVDIIGEQSEVKNARTNDEGKFEFEFAIRASTGRI